MSSSQLFSKTAVVISGGAGFIGFHLSTRLLSLGAQVTILTRHVQAPQAVHLAKQGAQLVACDVSSPDGIPPTEHVRPAQLFIHLAADVTVSGPGLYTTNVDGTRRMLELADALRSPTFVLASSIEAQGLGTRQEIPLKETAPCRPESDYGRSKGQAEGLVSEWGRREGRRALILRIGNIYGPGSVWLFEPTLLVLLGANSLGPVWPQLRHRMVQPLYVADLVEGIVRALARQLNGLYNITGEEPVTIHQYFETLASLTGLSNPFGRLDSHTHASSSAIGIAPDFAYLLMGGPERCHRSYENGKLRSAIGPYTRWSLARGVASTLQWYHASGKLPSLVKAIRARYGTMPCASH